MKVRGCIALLLGLAALTFMLLLKDCGGQSEKRRQELAAAQRQADDQRRQAETILIAEHSRVERGVVGEWTNGSSRLTITKDGSKFRAEYPSSMGHQILHGTVQADNRLSLANEQVGKLVNPLRFYQGDFSQEAWAELSADGSTLIISQSANGRSFVMHRSERGSSTVVHENADVTSQLAKKGAPTINDEERETRASIVRVNRNLRPEIPILLSGTRIADYAFMDPDLQASGPPEFDVEKLEKRSDHFKGKALYDHLKESGVLVHCLNLQDLMAIQARDLKFFYKHFPMPGYTGFVPGWKSAVEYRDSTNPNRVIFFYPYLTGSLFGHVSLNWGHDERRGDSSPSQFETITYLY